MKANPNTGQRKLVQVQRKPDNGWYSDAELVVITTLDKSTMFRLRHAGKFPKSEFITAGRKATRASEVHRYLADPIGYGDEVAA